MKKILFLSLFLMTVLIVSNSQAQSRVSSNLFTVVERESLPGANSIDALVSKSVLLELNRSELQSLYNAKPENLEIYIPVSSDEFVIVSLEKFDILKPYTRIVEMTEDGERDAVLGDLVISYKGHIAGSENSTVIFNFTKEDILAMMSNESGNYVIGKLNTGDASLDEKFALYFDRDLKIKNDFMCDTSDDFTDEEISAFRRDVEKNGFDNILNAPLLEADIALDIDYITYLAYGSDITNTTNYIMKLMTAVSTLYMKDVNIKLVSSYIRIWTTPDPYTGTGSNAILNQFRNHWNATQTSVQRTVAHLISVRSGGLGGIAWVNVLCASPFNGNGYGFSNTGGTVNQLPTYSWDVMVVAHELGHNFGSAHTHSCNAWSGGPIDSCYTVEGNCYNGPAIPRTGTIMSYCHLTSGGISFVLGFGQQPGNIIRIRANAAGCITSAAEPLILAYPQGGETYRTNQEVPIYWGTNLTGFLNIEFSTDNGAAWQTIAINVDAQTRTYNWTVPYIGFTDQALIRMYDAGSPSIGDTTNATFTIILNFATMQNVSPPTLTTLNVSSGNNQPIDFVWTSAGTHPSLSYKWSIRRGGTPLTSNLYFESNSNGADTTKTMTISMLDSIAETFGLNVGDSALALWSGWAYNGFDSASTNTFIIVIKRTTVGIENISSEIPNSFALYNNYPNPFNPVTNIKFDLPKNVQATLKVFDISGREVATLVNQEMLAGSYNYIWDATAMSSGIYFYELSTPEFRKVNRMVLVK